MKQRIYIDTSVVGGYFDDEFKDATVELFDMKTIETEKAFDAVKMMREARDKISSETQNATFAELKAYIEKKKKESGLKPVGE
ncbi:MAG: hypothetical protein WA960_08845 [Tunicatimonas sp.]